MAIDQKQLEAEMDKLPPTTADTRSAGRTLKALNKPETAININMVRAAKVILQR